MWSRTEGGCVEARGVPLRRRRDGRVWKEQWAKANVRRNGTDPSEKQLSSFARRFVCQRCWSQKYIFEDASRSSDASEREALWGDTMPSSEPKSAFRASCTRTARASRVSTVVSPSLLAR